MTRCRQTCDLAVAICSLWVRAVVLVLTVLYVYIKDSHQMNIIGCTESSSTKLLMEHGTIYEYIVQSSRSSSSNVRCKTGLNAGLDGQSSTAASLDSWQEDIFCIPPLSRCLNTTLASTLLKQYWPLAVRISCLYNSIDHLWEDKDFHTQYQIARTRVAAACLPS